ncbi:MAG: hypothetical protein KDC95_08670 [Planctomycetes bacterium]|nr:hypothetical protein [Planctomycetota bacterium]
MRLLGAFVLASLALLPPAASQDVAPSRETRARVQGRVYDVTGASWALAKVVLHARADLTTAPLDAEDTIACSCDDAGRFAADIASGRTYDVFAYDASRVSRVALGVAAGEQIRLVVDARRSPIETLHLVGLEAWKDHGVSLCLLDSIGRRHALEPDAEGAARLPALPGSGARVEISIAQPGPLERRIGHGRIASIEVPLPLRGDERPLRLELPAPLVARVRVVDANGAPCVGARVVTTEHDRLLAPRPRFEPWPAQFAVRGRVVETNQDGVADVLLAYSKDAVDVTVEVDGHAPTVIGWNDATRDWPSLDTERAAQPPELVATIAESVDVEIRVIGLDRSPVHTERDREHALSIVAELHSWEKPGESILRRFVTLACDANGTARVAIPKRGRTKLMASLALPSSADAPLPRFLRIASRVYQDPDEHTSLVLDMAAYRVIALTLGMPDRSRAAGFDAIVTSQAWRGRISHPLYAGARSDRRGICRVLAPRGEFAVAVYGPEHFAEAHCDAGKDQVFVELKDCAVLEGFVRGVDGGPCTGAEVRHSGGMTRPFGDEFFATRAARNERLLVGTTDEDGRYRVCFVPDETDKVRVRASWVDDDGVVWRSLDSPMVGGASTTADLVLRKQ